MVGKASHISLTTWSLHKSTKTWLSPIGSTLAHIMSILCQGEDNCPTNLGTSILWGPTEVFRRRTIQTINFRTDATYPQHSANPRPILQFKTNLSIHCQSDTNPRLIFQSKANPGQIRQHSIKLPICCHSITNHQSGNPLPILNQSFNTRPFQQSSTNFPSQ